MPSFMLCPFVFELRTIMDWVWTETSMTLPDWLKMEDIFAHIFQLKVLLLIVFSFKIYLIPIFFQVFKTSGK